MTTTHSLCSVFLVRGEHLNHQGHLFGGDLMAEIDSIGFCLMRKLWPDLTFVTRAAEIEFIAPARLGEMVDFEAVLERTGNTSVTVTVTGRVGDREMAKARMIYVCLGADKKKTPVPPLA